MKWIFAIEGPHGVGKTTLLKKFKSRGKINMEIGDDFHVDFPVVEENFLDSNHKNINLNKTGLISETMWVSQWFSKVLATLENEDIVVTDRSPYSACIYTSSNKFLLRQLIDEQVQELEKMDIKLVTLYLKVPIDVTWTRILNRFSENPEENLERLFLNENDYDFLRNIYNIYEQKTWTFTITSLDELVEIIKKF